VSKCIYTKGHQGIPMSKSYFKTCDYCKEKIEMSDREGKWLPYNLNNGPHDCSMRHKKEITLEMIQTKLESIGIIINLNRLMNQ
jgi:hypothetical protein